ncbi:heat shock 70 kDa protein 12A-like [Argopecten irradians]|uniref:heat shock 70 kDa protein 12A-like n=1 Tax=Argopecten irradians TaxID=31199 RepID=UPI00371F156A
MKEVVSHSFTLGDDQGQSMPAITVFTAAIRYLKNHMIESMSKSGACGTSDILWVITVPAIFSDASKEFMQEAAVEAGIRKDYLIISLESEAAFIYCKHLPLDQRGNDGLKAFTSGSKYLVLDAGGETVDITLHEIQKDGSMDVIEKTSVGDWGGTKVDRAYQDLLLEIVGNVAFYRFRESKSDMSELFRYFEAKKRAVRPNTPGDIISFWIPAALEEACENANDTKIDEMINSDHYFMDNLDFVHNRYLKVNGDRAVALFKEPVEHIVSHLENMLKKPSATEVKTILVVGGFSESLVLQEKLKLNFSNLRVITSKDAGMAVLSGAVMLGHQPLANLRIERLNTMLGLIRETSKSDNLLVQECFVDELLAFQSPIIKTVMAKTETQETTAAVKIIWELGFDEKNRVHIKNRKDLLKKLKKLRRSENPALAEVASFTYFVVNDLVDSGSEENSEGNDLVDSDSEDNGRRTSTPTIAVRRDSNSDQKSIPTAVPKSPRQPLKPTPRHIMVSYNRTHQPMALKVYESLKEHKFPVWIDVEDMKGNVLDSMSQAILDAKIVIICASKDYGNSQNCRTVVK